MNQTGQEDVVVCADRTASFQQQLNRYSHDLRGPLNVIFGFVDLLALGVGGPLTSKQAAMLADVRKEADAILTIANRMQQQG